MRLPQKMLGKFGALPASAFLLSLGMWSAMALTPDADIRRDATVAAIEQVMPSVVNIRTTQLVRRNDPYEAIFRRFYRLEETPQIEERPSHIGSGVIVDAVGEEGYILTNVHVVDRANRVQVQLWDGREYEAVKLLGQTSKDLALLKIVRRPGEPPFRPITMAKDDDLLLGETVIAVGNPFGLGGSVSRGILSSKNRRSDAGDEQLDYADWLQTDADINPGNSGGPLINIRGELIGINAAVYATDQGKGTGFAIPIKQVSSVLSDFFTLEWSAKLWLGARFRGAPYPLTVREVVQGSPAEEAGLRVGQEVVEVNGKPAQSLAAFNQLVAAGANQRASVTVLENGGRRVLKLELVPLTQLNRQLLLKRLGLNTTPLTEVQAASFQMAPSEGLLVTTVEKGSPADTAKLEAGMVVTKVDGVPVSDLVYISNILRKKNRGESVHLAVKVANRYGGMIRVLEGTVDMAVR